MMITFMCSKVKLGFSEIYLRSMLPFVISLDMMKRWDLLLAYCSVSGEFL